MGGVTTLAPEHVSRQQAELSWWREYLAHPTAKQRMWALYGARYYPFFWREMATAGSCIEIGSGPLPVMEIMDCRNMVAVDPLAAEYREMAGWPIASSTREIDVDGRWDTVLLLNVLDHTDDPADLAREAARLLRPGKRCLIYVQIHAGDDRHEPVSVADVRRWIREAGLDIQREDVIEAVYDPDAYVAVATKPSWTDAETLDNIAAALEPFPWWLTCGAALGYYRDGALIEWDHDIDVGIDAAAVDVSALRSALAEAGWRSWRRLGTPADGYVMQLEHPLSQHMLDIYFHYLDGDELRFAVYPTSGRKHYVYDAFTPQRVTFLGVDVPIMPLSAVQEQYGPDWRTPNPEWDWTSDPQCLR